MVVGVVVVVVLPTLRVCDLSIQRWPEAGRWLASMWLYSNYPRTWHRCYKSKTLRKVPNFSYILGDNDKRFTGPVARHSSRLLSQITDALACNLSAQSRVFLLILLLLLLLLRESTSVHSESLWQKTDKTVTKMREFCWWQKFCYVQDDETIYELLVLIYLCFSQAFHNKSSVHFFTFTYNFTFNGKSDVFS